MGTRLAQMKLKVRQAAAPGTVWVWQDGSAADADASPGKKYDDAFNLGAAGHASVNAAREYIVPKTLKNSYENGKELTFMLIGRRAWLNDPHNATQVGPNDVVEFFAETPDKTASVAVASWHLNTATAGVRQRLFYGHARQIRSTTDGLEVTCTDPRWKANIIKLQRSIGDGITIPKIAFNLPRDHPDYAYNSIKIKDQQSSTPWGVGESKETDPRCTVRQVLEYLAHHYKTALILHGVQDVIEDSLFHPDDLSHLTYKMGPLVLENTGFYDGVKQILNAWAPHLKLVIDHRTTRWRFVQYGPSIKGNHALSTTPITAIGGQPYASKGSVNDVAGFSAVAGSNGNRVRIYEASNFSINEERTIHSIVGSELRFNETGLRDYITTNAKVFPIDAEALPNLLLNVDDTPRGGVDIALDLDNVWTAVNLWSVYQKTSSYEQSWNRQDMGSGPLQPAWDTAFEIPWTDRDSDREMDVGADGQGMKPYRTGNDGTNDYLEISFAHSQYATGHANNEWKDVSLWVWTANGVNVRNTKISFTVKSSTQVADVGDGSTGLRIVLEAGVGGFLANAPGFKTIEDPSATEDRVVLTQNYGLLPTTKGNNKRWEVGRKFYFTDTSIQFDTDATPHVSTCSPLKLWEDNGTETPRRAVGMHPNLGYPTLNFTPTGAWETLATGGLGATHVWRRATYTRKPTGSPCAGGSGWKPPKLVQVEFEKTETTLRNARFPLDGFGGVAFGRYNFQAQHDIAVSDWAEDSQTPDYTALALRLFQKFSQAHHSGTVRKPGLKENGIWLDLGIRCSMHSTVSSTQYGSTLEGFWGVLTECTYDFGANEVVFGFDNQHGAEEFSIELYETQGIKRGSQVQDAMELWRKLHELPKCLQGSMMGEGPSSMCGDRVYAPGGTSISHHTSVITKPQQQAGMGGSGAGMSAAG